MLLRNHVARMMLLLILCIFCIAPVRVSGKGLPSPDVAIDASDLRGTPIVFTVNTTADADDASPGNGVCAAANGKCTLRAAVSEAGRSEQEVLILLPAGTFQFTATPEHASAHLETGKKITIQGVSPSQTILDGSFVAPDGKWLPVIHSYGDLTLRRLTLINGWFSTQGEAFYDAFTTYGGVTARNQLLLDEVIVTGNPTGGVYAAPFTRSNVPVSTPNVTIRNSAIHTNGSTGVLVVGSLTMVNSTVSGNSSGGIIVDGSATISNSTVTANTITDPGYSASPGIDHSSEVGTVILSHTIVSGNHSYAQPTDCRGSIVSNGYNLIGVVGDCAFSAKPSDILNNDPLLDSLAQNNGLTPTHALLPDSPAIDAGNPAGCGLSRDQRGFHRPSDGDEDGTWVCDIGAFEDQFNYPYHAFLPAISN